MKLTLQVLVTLVFIFFIKTEIYAGNTCATATPISNNMSLFETYSNIGNTGSTAPAPPCGNYISNDFWFSTTVPASGNLNVVILSGTMTDAAMAVYSGFCSSLTLEGCSAEDLCGDAADAIFDGSGLTPGSTVYIRVWAVGGAPNGDFQIRVSQSNSPAPIPIHLDALVGTANTSGDCVQLTIAQNTQLGCAWDSNQHDLTQTFEKAVTLNFGTNDGGADGITIGFQNSPAGLSACGNGGGGIGAQGITNSFIVEFDTWNNGAAQNDIGNDHASIYINGNVNVGVAPINGPIDLGNIEDGQDHTARLKWNGTTMDYEVYFDEVLIMSGNYDIVNNCLGGGTMAYWGATSSTGGANNNQSICPYVPPTYDAGVEQIVNAEICQGESYFAGGANQTTTGVYFDNTLLPNGCFNQTTTNLTVLPNATSTVNEAVCFGDCVTIGTIMYCNPGSFNAILPNASALGCDSIVTLNLDVLSPQSVIVQFPQPNIDCANPTIFLDGANSSTGPGYSYQWSGPCVLSNGNTLFPEVGCPGTYTLLVTQIQGTTVCSNSSTVQVLDNTTLPTADAGLPQTLDCATGCTFLDGTGSSNGPDFIYSWSGPSGFTSSDQNPEVCNAGTYTLIVFNSISGCLSDPSTVEVSGNASPVADAGMDMAIDCGNPSVTLDGSNSDSGAGFNLVWLDAGGTQVGTGATLTTGNVGTYTLVVTNTTSGCSTTDEAIISGNANLPNADAGMDLTIDCNNVSANLNGSNSDSGTGFDLVWFDATGVQVGVGTNFNTGNAGTYTLVVTNTSNGCSSSDDVIVTDNSNFPNADAGMDVTIDCNNLSVNLDGSNSDSGTGFDLIWLDVNGIPVGIGTTLNTANTGTYTLVVTNTTNGCSANDDVIVTDNSTLPFVNAGPDATIDCNNTTATLDGNNSNSGTGYDLVWFDASGVQVGVGITLNTATQGTYTLVVTNTATGCSASDDAIISGNANLPNADAGMDMTIDCTNSSVTLNGNNSDSGMGFDLVWYDASGGQVGTGPNLNTPNAGTYTLVVTNTSNGCSSSDDAIVSGNANLPNADAGMDMTIDCANSSVNLNGSNSDSGTGFDLVWFDASGGQVGTGTNLNTPNSGTYTLVVTNTSNGCSASDDVIVSGNTTPPNADAGMDMTIDCNNTSATLDGNNSDSGTGFDLVWFDATGAQVGVGATLNTPNSGTYTLIVTNNSTGCSATDEAIISENNTLPNADAGMDATINCNNTSATLDGNNSDSGTGFDLVWFDATGAQAGVGATLNTPNTGTYTLVVTNISTGCSATDEATISGSTDFPIADAGAMATLDCDILQVTLNGSNSSTGSNFSYQWQNSSMDNLGTQILQDVSTPDTYTLIVTNDDNGCSSTSTVVVDQNITPPVVDAGLGGTLSCTSTSITLDGSNSVTGGNYNYDWFNSSSTNVGSGIMINVASADTYTLLVTNTDNGCTATDDVIISQDTNVPTVTASSDGDLTCTNLMVNLDGTGSSAGAGINYEWFNDQSTSLGNGISITTSDAGTYSLVVTDSGTGCSSSINVIIAENTTDPAIVIATPNQLTCTSNQVTLDGSGSASGANFNFEWFDSNTTSVGNGEIINVGTADFYTLVITNTDNGCTSSETIQVTQDANVPVANIDAITDTLNCMVGNIMLESTGSSMGTDFSLEWKDGNDILGNDPTLEINTPGIYTLVVSNDINGCSTETDFIIGQDLNTPNISTDANTITCAQPSATLDGTGSSIGNNFSYEWQNSTGGFLSNNLTFQVDQTGMYNFVVTNNSNGCTSTETIFVNEDISNLVADAGANATLTCGSASVTLNGINSTINATTEFQWINSAGTLLGNDLTLETSTADTFYLIVTDPQNGCADTSFVEVLQDANLPTADIFSDEIITCENEEVILDGNGSTGIGSLTYTWIDPNGDFISNDNNIEVMIIGNYELTVVDMSNGCSATTSFLVEEDMIAPISNAGENDTLSCNANAATLDGTGSDIGTNFSYEWISPGGASVGIDPILNTAESGIFTLVVTNADNGCSTSSTVEVVQSSSQPTAVISPPVTISCAQQDAFLDGAMSSGIGQLNFQWYNSAGQQIGATPNITVAQSGTYVLDIIDTSNGCVASTSVLVESNFTEPDANTNAPGAINCLQNSYTITAENSSTGGTYQYEWQDATGSFLTNDFSYDATTSGIYNLIVTDISNGCSAQTTTEVLEDFVEPTSIPVVIGTLDCDTDEVILEAIHSLGTNGSPLFYEWLDPMGNSLGATDSIFVMTPGLYELIVTNNSNGCSNSSSILIDEDVAAPQPIIDALTDLNLSCDQNSLVVDASSSSPIGNVTYEWTQNNVLISTDPNPQINSPGELFLTVTNTINGCSETTSVIIAQDNDVPNIVFENPDLLTCATTTIQLDASNSTTGNDIIYAWTGPGTIQNETTLTPTINQPGFFTLTIINTSNGCEISSNIPVNQDAVAPNINISPAAEFNCTTDMITLDASNSSVGNNFIYNWTTTNGNISNNANTLNPTILTAGNYTLEITNTTNGCTSNQNITVNESNDVISSLELSILQPLCFGDLGSFFVENVNGGTPPFLYSVDNQPLSSNVNFNLLNSGNYNLLVEDATGCQYSENIVIDFVPEIIATLPHDVTIELGENYELQPQINIPISTIESWIWTPSDSLSCNDCPFPIANPFNSIGYQLTATDFNGCSDTANIFIHVEKPRDVFIPNIFSPNDDGINDIFYIFAKESMVKQVNKFQIFTRWGELVFSNEEFQPNQPTEGWDGYFRGKKMNPGVLVYFAEIEFIDGLTRIYKGDVTLKN